MLHQDTPPRYARGEEREASKVVRVGRSGSKRLRGGTDLQFSLTTHLLFRALCSVVARGRRAGGLARLRAGLVRRLWFRTGRGVRWATLSQPIPRGDWFVERTLAAQAIRETEEELTFARGLEAHTTVL